MTLNLSPEQVRQLLAMLHLGEWVINADRRHHGEPHDEYLRLLNLVCAQLADAESQPAAENAADLVEQDEADDRWYPAPAVEDEANAFLDEYDNNTFWEELITRMAERDLIRRHGEAQVASLSEEDRQVMLAPLKEQYHAEFYANGLDSVVISDRNLN